MKIKKALIAAAGYGTRFLPITKTIQKEMLPILDRPIVDYIVEDCIKAGIEEIIFVISSKNQQIRHFYSEDLNIKKYLESKGKHEQAKQVAQLHSKAKFSFIEQPDNSVYGTAVPVLIAKNQLKDEDAFIVFMGDDFIYNADGSSEAKRMIEVFTSSEAFALTTCITVPNELVQKYAAVEFKTENNYRYLTNIIEKPPFGTAPSNLVSVSKYIYTSEIFDIIEKQNPNSQSGELYITDSILTLSRAKNVVIHNPVGQYLDCGYAMGWLKANLTVANNDTKLSGELKELISTL